MHQTHPPAAESSKVEALHSTIREALAARFGQDIISSSVDYDFPVFIISKTIIHQLLEFLKQEHGFNFLTTMCGIHYPSNKGQEFALMYQLHNLPKNQRIRLKIFMATDDLEVPTASDIWPTANWMEREAYDFYGFRFTGHPDLRRILNMDEMNYFPMRKEYPLEDSGRADKKDRYFGR